VTLTPKPAANWAFSWWSGADSGSLTDNGDGTWSIDLNSDKELQANFAGETTGNTLVETFEGDGTWTGLTSGINWTLDSTDSNPFIIQDVTARNGTYAAQVGLNDLGGHQAWFEISLTSVSANKILKFWYNRAMTYEFNYFVVGFDNLFDYGPYYDTIGWEIIRIPLPENDVLVTFLVQSGNYEQHDELWIDDIAVVDAMPVMSVDHGSTPLTNDGGVPAPVDIGSFYQNYENLLTITNLGEMDLTVDSISYDLTAGFVLFFDPTNGGTTPQVISPGETLDFGVKCDIPGNPTTSGTFTIVSNDPVENPWTFQVTGDCRDQPYYYESFDSGLAPWTTANLGSTGSPGDFATYLHSSHPSNTRDHTPFSPDTTAFGELSDGKYAFADSDLAGTGTTLNTELVSPVIDLTGSTTPFLEFDFGMYHLPTDTVDVEIKSTLTGGSWTTLTQYYVNIVERPVFNIAAQAADQSNVQLRFHYITTGFHWYTMVDNVVIYENTGPANPEIEVFYKSTLLPSDGTDTSIGTIYVGSNSVTITNNGIFGDLTVTDITMGGGGAPQITFSGAATPQVIAPGSSFDFTFNCISGGAGPYTSGLFTVTHDDTDEPNQPDYTFTLTADDCIDPPIWTENFETSVPPGAWTTSVSGGAIEWDQSIGTVHPSGGQPSDGSYLAYCNSWTFGTNGYEAYLDTDLQNFSGLSNISLVFDMYHDTGYPDATDTLQIQYDQGGGFLDIGPLFNRYDAGGNAWDSESVDLSALGGLSDITLRFKCTSNWGNDVHIDNVRLFGN
jgi:hypothetical protein